MSPKACGAFCPTSGFLQKSNPKQQSSFEGGFSSLASPPDFYYNPGAHSPTSSSTTLNLFPKRLVNVVAKATPSLPVALAVLILGFFLGRRVGSRGGLGNSGRMSNANDLPTTGLAILTQSKDTQYDEGVTPIWLNYGLARLWSLFQKSTKRLMEEVLQPIIDEAEKPEFITDVRLKRFLPGKRAPYFTSLKRLPSRALAEVQYSYQCLFSSRSEFLFDVDVIVAKRKFTIPVTITNMDIDALAWSSLNLAPYEPYCTRAQVSLLEKPKISFDIDVAGVVPLQLLPGLKGFFFDVLSKELPKPFLYPKTNVLDFTPEIIKEGNAMIASMKFQNMETMSEEELKAVFVEQWALFNVLDLNNDNTLSPVEIFAGLKDWGYTAQDASESFQRLDINNDETVNFSEFCKMWPSIASDFVPSRFQGLVSIFVRGASDLELPNNSLNKVMSFAGKMAADPYVEISTFGGDNDKEEEADAMRQSAETKPDSMASENGKPGFPIWNEAFELNCRDPKEEVLRVVVREGAQFKFRDVIGVGTVPMSSFRQNPTQKLSIPLKPQGSLEMDVSYADFVDRIMEVEEEEETKEEQKA